MSEVSEFLHRKTLLYTMKFSVLTIGVVGVLVFTLTTPISLLVGGEYLYLTAMGSAAFCIFALIGIVASIAMEKSGWCRKAFRYMGANYTYPPLDEWEDDLEERGAFEVKYESE